jgi:hypothetical protein
VVLDRDDERRAGFATACGAGAADVTGKALAGALLAAATVLFACVLVTSVS